jgi:hypothetical protein
VPNRAWTLLALEPTHGQQLHGRSAELRGGIRW